MILFDTQMKRFRFRNFCRQVQVKQRYQYENIKNIDMIFNIN